MGSPLEPLTHERPRLCLATCAAGPAANSTEPQSGLRRFFRETREPCLIGTAQQPVRTRPLDQIGPLFERVAQRFAPAPELDFRMMTTEQYIGHPLALIFLGPRVVRTVEQTIDEAVLHGRLRIVEHARQL